MLNISNDGWFGHGTQQAQHLVNCAFRAIENRVGVARAVNTGISGFIDPDGRWRTWSSRGRKLQAGARVQRGSDSARRPAHALQPLRRPVSAACLLVASAAAGQSQRPGVQATSRPQAGAQPRRG